MLTGVPNSDRKRLGSKRQGYLRQVSQGEKEQRAE